MFCENCGGSINPGDISCPNCGISLSTAKIKSGNSGPVKTTGLLIFCIITLLFCFPFGLIGLIMYFTSLQDAIRTGDLPKIEKKKKNISNLLIVGIILGAILPLLLIFLIAIPNFSGIQNSMQIRADKSTAAQIGKATRIWYSEILMDPELQAIANEEEVENNFVRLDKIELLDNYISIDQEPNSYRTSKWGTIENAAYYVQIINVDDSPNEKIIVAIGPENLSNDNDDMLDEIFFSVLNEPLKATYDGTSSGIAYIEP